MAATDIADVSIVSGQPQYLCDGPIDLRSFIQALDGSGQLLCVSEQADWNAEIGRTTREVKRPLLFENVRGYPGQRIFTNGLSNIACIAMALNLTNSTYKDLVREAKKRVSNAIRPILVESGPVLENVVAERDLDLFELPVPHWHHLDAGRYLGTWHINVTKDSETSVRNLGVYRMQLLGRRTATVSASPQSHLARHVAKAEAAGRPLEMAVAIGVSEAIMLAAAAACPYEFDEYELAGGLQQRAVSLVRCQTVDLEVPAHSEIVIEGLIQPGVRVQDGPYFDYTGRVNTNPQAYLFEASRLCFRTNPIFRGTSIGVAGAEDHQLFAFLADLGLVNFHGSSLKQAIQNRLLKLRMFRAFQLSGRAGAYIYKKR
jgi:UbiD family decarboxylase